MIFIRIAVCTVLCAIALPAPAREEVLLANGDLSGWEAQQFKKIPVRTIYSTVYDAELGDKVVLAESTAGASGYLLKKELPFGPNARVLVKWRVDEATNPAADEKSREGDDFALRVYLYKSNFLLSAKVLMLVHALQHDSGTTWTNPYSTKLRQIENYAIGGPDTGLGKWVSAEVPAGKLWEQFFGATPHKLSGAAFMVDSDDAKGKMTTLISSIVLIND